MGCSVTNRFGILRNFPIFRRTKKKRRKTVLWRTNSIFIAIFVNIMPCCFHFTSEEELVPKAFLYIFFLTLQVELTKPMSNDLLCNPLWLHQHYRSVCGIHFSTVIHSKQGLNSYQSMNILLPFSPSPATTKHHKKVYPVTESYSVWTPWPIEFGTFFLCSADQARKFLLSVTQ